MTSLTWLDSLTPLPSPEQALPEGLLAAGGSLSLSRLTEAYSKGVFPWFNPGDPILWWSPDPRMILPCADLKISASFAKKLRQVARHEREPDARWRVTTDLAFRRVIDACASPRSAGSGTWISPEITAAYTAWHEEGRVHSVETWLDGELAGGLYGVCMGRFFFGESMFARRTDASKLALAYLTRFLMARGIHYIDCQQETHHLASMGARPIGRKAFLALLDRALQHPSPDWGAGQILEDGSLRRAEE